MIVNCSCCGKEMKVKPYRIKRLKNKKITCSKKCSNKEKSKYYMGRNNPNTTYKNLDDNFFKNIDSIEKAYLLGWIASDGSIGKGGAITIAIDKGDRECLSNLRDIICKDLPIKRKNETIISFTINSKTMAKDICKYLKVSPGKKSGSVRMPKLKSKKLKWSFLRGVFEGDGSIPKPTKRHKVRCSITTNSVEFLSEISEFSDVNPYNNKKDKVEFYGKKAISFLNSIYKDSSENTRLSRKYNSYQNLLEQYQ